MTSKLVEQSEKAYAFLIKLYPKSYKKEFAEEMQFVFTETLKEAEREKGAEGILEMWLRTSIDFFKSVIIEHLQNTEKGDSMKTKQTATVQHSALRIVAITTGILTIPFVGMLVSSEWNWTVSDFVVIGVLVAGITTMIEGIRHNVRNPQHRIIFIAGLVLLGLWIWVELAVGLFTNWGS